MAVSRLSQSAFRHRLLTGLEALSGIIQIRPFGILSAVIFVLFTLIGLWLGLRLQPASNRQNAIYRPLPSAQTSQGNTLLWIFIDQFKTDKPKLAGIWLLSYAPGYRSIQSTPVYPSDDPHRNLALEQAFSLPTRSQINPEFWSLLQADGFPNSRYLAIDTGGLAILLSKGGDKGQATHEQMIQQIAPVGGRPAEALLGQARLLNDLCWNFPNLRPADFKNLSKKLQPYVVTDLSPEDQSWHELLNGDTQRLCDFTAVYSRLQTTLAQGATAP